MGADHEGDIKLIDRSSNEPLLDPGVRLGTGGMFPPLQHGLHDVDSWDRRARVHR